MDLNQSQVYKKFQPFDEDFGLLPYNSIADFSICSCFAESAVAEEDFSGENRDALAETGDFCGDFIC